MTTRDLPSPPGLLPRSRRLRRTRARGGGRRARSPRPATEPAEGTTSIGEISTDLTQKPEIPKPSGEPPAELQTEDIVEGTGPAAKAGDTVSMQYVGNAWTTGEQFDASWDRNQAFPFTLGAGDVIAGWDQGIVGMKAGGRRLLIIPPELGYGEAGAGADRAQRDAALRGRPGADPVAAWPCVQLRRWRAAVATP